MARARSARREGMALPAWMTAGNRKDQFARYLPSPQALRRAIPYLAALYLLIAAASAVGHLTLGRQAALDDARDRLYLVADTLAARFAATAPDADWQAALGQALSGGATTADGRRLFLADPQGRVQAAIPRDAGRIGEPLLSSLGADQLLMTFGVQAGVLGVTLPDGTAAIATVRNIEAPPAQLAVVQPIDAVLGEWRRAAGFDLTVLFTTGLLLLLLASGFLRTASADERAGPAAGTGADIEAALAAAGCGLWRWNVARGQVTWSPTMHAMLGQAAADGPLPFREVARACDGGEALYAAADRALGAGAGVFDHELRLRHAEGGRLPVRLTGLLRRCEATGEPHLTAVAVPLQSAPADTAGTDASLRDAIEAISEAFVLWDRDNRLVLCNSKYQQFHRLPAEAVRPGTAYDDVLAAASQPLVRTRIPVSDGEGPGAQTYEAQLEDGRWLHVNERRTRDGGFVSVGTDVTELKKSEQRLFDRERELKARIADLNLARRAQEQQKQQLVDLAEKYQLEKNRAEAANRSKSEFLANISHELRTPLNAVIGFSDVMRNGLFGPLGNAKYEEYARDIHDSGQYLLEVINDILDMSKIEAGRIALNIETIDLTDIVEDSLKIVSPAAAERSVVLKRTGLTGLEIQADRRAIKQILLNLLANAVKFTPDGGRVSVRLERRAKGRVAIAIADTGIGIPEDKLGTLGRPFEQVENQFTKTRSGSGLGLAISRSLVEMHGGHLEMVSREGQGTTVTCVLPARPLLASDDAA